MDQTWIEAARGVYRGFECLVAMAVGGDLPEKVSVLNGDMINMVIRTLDSLGRAPDAPPEFYTLSCQLRADGEMGPMTRKTITLLEKLIEE